MARVRSNTQGNTREKIVDAAYRVLAEQGYEAATVKEIARAAGVAPGLLHYYFASKDDLLVEVLSEASSRYGMDMRQAASLSRPAPRGQQMETALAEPLARLTRQPEWYRLRYELFALGLRNPAILPGVDALLAKGREGIGNVIQAIGGDAISDEETRALAAILLASFDGLALQKLANPDFELEAAYRLLARITRLLLRAE
jgi:AcrR family transcriptional regulator